MNTFLLTFLFLISSVYCIPFARTTTSLCHPHDEFSCKNGLCIPLEWSCDNVNDCYGGEDEKDCHYLHECPSNTFMCRTSECVPKEAKCNGQSDCSDGSDEHGCPKVITSKVTKSPSPSFSTLCHHDEFSCKNGLCIPLEWSCDNVNDCYGGEDEKNCHYLHDCPRNTLMCRSGECVPKEYKCDGRSDCIDGSDEHGCPPINFTTTTSTTTTKSPLSSSSSSLPHTDNSSLFAVGSCSLYILIVLVWVVLVLTCFAFIPLPHQLSHRRDLIFARFSPKKSVKKGPMISPAAARMHPQVTTDDTAGFHNPTFNTSLLMNDS